MSLSKVSIGNKRTMHLRRCKSAIRVLSGHCSNTLSTSPFETLHALAVFYSDIIVLIYRALEISRDNEQCCYANTYAALCVAVYKLYTLAPRKVSIVLINMIVKLMNLMYFCVVHRANMTRLFFYTKSNFDKDICSFFICLEWSW